ncbi:MAG: hypothetical protein ABW140_14305, partial [Candidatus Sedimenticola sp. 6PFRAG1]
AGPDRATMDGFDDYLPISSKPVYFPGPKVQRTFAAQRTTSHGWLGRTAPPWMVLTTTFRYQAIPFICQAPKVQWTFAARRTTSHGWLGRTAPPWMVLTVISLYQPVFRFPGESPCLVNGLGVDFLFPCTTFNFTLVVYYLKASVTAENILLSVYDFDEMSSRER